MNVLSSFLKRLRVHNIAAPVHILPACLTGTALSGLYSSLLSQDDEEEEGDGRRGKKRLKRSRFVDDIAAVDEDEEDEEDDQVCLVKRFCLY